MDPLSALSIATSVVQFVEFTIKVILKAKEIQQNGCTIEVDTIKKHTEEVRAWVAGLNAPGEGRDEALKTEYKVLTSSGDDNILKKLNH